MHGTTRKHASIWLKSPLKQGGTMKYCYEEVEIKIITFAVDIITASDSTWVGAEEDGDFTTIPGWW